MSKAWTYEIWKYATCPLPICTAQFKEKSGAWQKAFANAQEELSQTTVDEKRNTLIRDFNKLYRQRAEFMIEDRTELMWLYLWK